MKKVLYRLLYIFLFLLGSIVFAIVMCIAPVEFLIRGKVAKCFDALDEYEQFKEKIKNKCK